MLNKIDESIKTLEVAIQSILNGKCKSEAVQHIEDTLGNLYEIRKELQKTEKDAAAGY